MASGTVRVSDIIVPSVFTPYVQLITTEKARVVQSGLLVPNPALSNILAGGGLTFDVPSFKDLDNEAENVSTDDPSSFSSPKKLGTAHEVAVRLNRNQSWSSMDLAAQLAGRDPAQAIASRVGYYWARRLQAAVIATVTGVLADNAAAPGGTEHVQNDLTVDASDDAGGSFSDGVTNFTAEGFIDSAGTMGDSMDSLGAMLVHSVVYQRMQKNNMIDFVPDSSQQINIPTFLGREVIVDDGMPASAGVYETWIFGRGALAYGTALPPVPTETIRVPSAGVGSGQDTLHNRVQWCIHPVGHKYAGTAANGGPSNAATSNNLAHLDSWVRVYPERKMIKLARYITREA